MASESDVLAHVPPFLALDAEVVQVDQPGDDGEKEKQEAPGHGLSAAPVRARRWGPRGGLETDPVPPHQTNLSLRIANSDIFNSSQPCRNRLMFVVP